MVALGWRHDHDESTHQIWVHEATRQVVPIDVKWDPVDDYLLKHIVTEQMKTTRERFYGATKATARKIGLRWLSFATAPLVAVLFGNIAVLGVAERPDLCSVHAQRHYPSPEASLSLCRVSPAQ
jgi:hypothetical protein